MPVGGEIVISEFSASGACCAVLQNQEMTVSLLRPEDGQPIVSMLRVGGARRAPRPLTDPTVRDYRSGFLSVNSPRIPGVRDTRAQQGMALQKVVIGIPREGFAPRAPVKPLVPETADPAIELP